VRIFPFSSLISHNGNSFSGNIDKFKNIFASLNTVVIKYQKLIIYLVSFKYLKHLYHFATMVTVCVAISQRKD
jgi:hypothetical protein